MDGFAKKEAQEEDDGGEEVGERVVSGLSH